MNDREWDTFFDLLWLIVDGSEPWQEKRQKVRDEAAARGIDTSVEEFLGWFEE